MRRFITALLLATTIATPALAQNNERREARQAQRAANPQWQSPEVRQGRRELRQDRREIRQGQRSLERNLATGDTRGARYDARELQRDRRELGRDRAELRRDRFADRNGWSGSVAERRRDYRQDRRDDRGDWRDDRRDWRSDRRDDRRDWRADRGDWGGGRWNNDWRNDRRYDWQRYRSANRSLYRGPRFFAPRGYSYRRWSPGYRIDPYFYGSNYWIADPWAYRLPPAYGDYRWVRYYDDVALIDLRSGLIEDIIYSFFLR